MGKTNKLNVNRSTPAGRPAGDLLAVHQKKLAHDLRTVCYTI